MPVDCSCKGYNPNCFRCYGTGSYDEIQINYPKPPTKQVSNSHDNDHKFAKKAQNDWYMPGTHAKSIIKSQKRKNKAHTAKNDYDSSTTSKDSRHLQTRETDTLNGKTLTLNSLSDLSGISLSNKKHPHPDNQRSHKTITRDINKSTSSKSLPNLPQTVTCPICELKMDITAFTTHVDNFHYFYLKNKKRPLSSVIPKELRRTTEGATPFKATKQKRKNSRQSTKANHEQNKQKCDKQPKKNGDKGSLQYYCPRCHESMSFNKLIHHVSKCNGIAATKKQTTAKTQTKNRRCKESKNKAYTQTITPSHTTRAPSPEGSSTYKIFREQGRFGSYPSFDSMDDESKP